MHTIYLYKTGLKEIKYSPNGKASGEAQRKTWDYYKQLNLEYMKVKLFSI
jgi:hypothetical protein